VTTPEAVGKLLYTPTEAARALGMSRSTLYVLMANGKVPSARIGASRRVPVKGLRRYVTALSADASEDARPAAPSPRQQSLWR